MGGVSFSGSDPAGVLGGAVGWELTARLNIEVTTRWLMPNDGADAFAFMFTAQRMTPPGVPSGSKERFTDPAVVFGGGVSIFASRNVSIRPEVETIWLRSDGMNYFVTSATVRFAYHFEEHRITAAVRPR